jgi:hypothetical protein
MTTWKELEAQGVRRCSVHFKTGKQCRCRASEKFEWSWCEKHGPTMQAYTDYASRVLAAQARKDSK